MDSKREISDNYLQLSERVRRRDKARQETSETVDWHLVNTSYIMRHLQLSTTCCYASLAAQAVKNLLVCVCISMCVHNPQDVGKVYHTVNHKGKVTS